MVVCSMQRLVDVANEIKQEFERHDLLFSTDRRWASSAANS
jgi:hypothetical protein